MFVVCSWSFELELESGRLELEWESGFELESGDVDTIGADDYWILEAQSPELLRFARRRGMERRGTSQVSVLVEESRKPFLKPFLLQAPRLQHSPRRNDVLDSQLPTNDGSMMKLAIPQSVQMHNVGLEPQQFRIHLCPRMDERDTIHPRLVAIPEREDSRINACAALRSRQSLDRP